MSKAHSLGSKIITTIMEQKSNTQHQNKIICIYICSKIYYIMYTCTSKTHSHHKYTRSRLAGEKRYTLLKITTNALRKELSKKPRKLYLLYGAPFTLDSLLRCEFLATIFDYVTIYKPKHKQNSEYCKYVNINKFPASSSLLCNVCFMAPFSQSTNMCACI